jgi:hypothetical protein
MAAIVYVLCALTSGLCAVLLLREYRRGRSRLLLWSGLSFVGWAVNNVLVFADLIMWPAYDLSAVRAGASLIAVTLLLYGLIWDAA